MTTPFDDRLRGSPLVIMLDVDGTLAPIAPHPALAEVPAETRRAVARLAALPHGRVAIVSGRAAFDARRMVAVEHLWTIGNHGAEVLTPDGEMEVDPRVAPYAPAIARAARTLAPLLAPISEVVLEEKAWTLAVHFRRVDDSLLPRVRAAVEHVATTLNLRVTEGTMLYEVRPPVDVDKGTAVLALAERLGGLSEGASLLYAGDDTTDEDAFRALRIHHPHAVTVHVGSHAHTAAEFTLGGPEDLRAVLARLSLRVA